MDVYRQQIKLMQAWHHYDLDGLRDKPRRKQRHWSRLARRRARRAARRAIRNGT